MPLVTVSMWDEVLDERSEPQLIGAMTDALVDVMGEQMRPFTTVLLVGVSQRRWGEAGTPSAATAHGREVLQQRGPVVS